MLDLEQLIRNSGKKIFLFFLVGVIGCSYNPKTFTVGRILGLHESPDYAYVLTMDNRFVPYEESTPNYNFLVEFFETGFRVR